MRTFHHTSRQAGFTLTELIVGMVVATILTFVLVGSIVVWLGQYAVGSTRQQQSSNIQTALTRISDDIRQANAVLAQNTESDTNAPTATNKWSSTTTQLVLGKTPHDSSNNGLYDSAKFFTGKPDSIIYYLKNGTIYRRIVPAIYTGNVNGPIVNCTPVDPAGGCPTDTTILSDVTDLQFTYYDSTNASGAPPADTKSIDVRVTSSRQQSGQTVATTDNVRVSLVDLIRLVPPAPNGGGDPPTSPQTTAGLMAGPGGLQLGFSNITGRDVYSKGQILMQFLSSINVSNYRVDVANLGCGTRATFPAACTGQQPIGVTFASDITASPICAPGQTVTTGLTGLQSGCTLANRVFPTFNKAAFTAGMTTTINSDVTCILGTRSLQAKTKISGSLNATFCTNLTINGDVYITGDLTLGQQTVLRIANGVTKAPIIVVNGKVSMTATSIIPNSTGVVPYIISFYSRNSACSTSDSCTSIPSTDLYDSVTDSTDGISLSFFGQLKGSFYSYFDTVRIMLTDVTGSIAGQKIVVGNNSRLNLGDGIWPGE